MENPTTAVPEIKQSKTRPNSKMSYLVELYNSGIKTIPEIALKFEEAEKSGIIGNLKYTSPEFIAKKNHAYYKKLVNWYMNQAKHKDLIDAPKPVARVKKVVELIAPLDAPAAPEVDSSSDDLIPSL